MTQKSRLKQLERRAGGDVPHGIEIIIHSMVSKDDTGNLTSRPGFAAFVGLEAANLTAFEHETDEQFCARANARLAELKRAITFTEQKGT